LRLFAKWCEPHSLTRRSNRVRADYLIRQGKAVAETVEEISAF